MFALGNAERNTYFWNATSNIYGFQFEDKPPFAFKKSLSSVAEYDFALTSINSKVLPDLTSISTLISKFLYIIAGSKITMFSCWSSASVSDIASNTLSFAVRVPESLDKCSKIIATTAHRYGVDRKRHGPFSKNASLFGYDYSGGKTDDVTVVLGYVV